MTGSLSKSAWRYLLPVSIGLIAFFAISGGSILNVRNIAWLSTEDPAQHFLGWMFFRNAPLLQSPMGANPAFGLEVSTSIVYTDSIPLFAFLFKPFRSVLPRDFQYMGIWILLCFALQAVFAWKLIEKFSRNVWIQIFGAAFFTIAPPFLYRLHGHEALMGQWLILAALCLYFSARWSPWIWLGLLVVGLLVHAYLFVMIAAIWAADQTSRVLSGAVKARRVALSGALCLAVTALIMWQAGYFVVPPTFVAAGGFGGYRMNLLAPFQAVDGWSKIMSDKPGAIGEDEGFNFLGIGGLALAVLAAGESLRDRSILKRFGRVWPLAGAAVLLALYSLSKKIALGSHELGTIPIPGMLIGVTETFRVSGRMFWPMFYLIYLGAIYVLAIRYPPRAAAGILGVLLVCQTLDGSGGFSNLRNQLRERALRVSPLRSEFWNAAAGHYRKIIYVPPENKPRNYFDLCYYAASHGMAINIGASARNDPGLQVESAKRTQQAVARGEFEKDALYVFDGAADWELALAGMRARDRAGVIDIFRVLAPGWSDCTSCRTVSSFGPEGAIHRLLPYELGAPITFVPGGNSKDYILQGFSVAETWGTWTDQPNASFGFRLTGEAKSDLLLAMSSYAYVTPKHPMQSAEVFVNGQMVGRVAYEQVGSATTRLLRIPRGLAMARGGEVHIELRMPNAVAPSDAGEGSDGRRLGLGLVWASVSAAGQ